MTTKEQEQENPQHSNKWTKVTKKATTQEKGKWIPKVINMPIISYQERLPSTSTYSTTESTTKTTEIQSQKQPLCGKNPLEAARQLVFILRTLNSKQVEAQWRQSIWHLGSKVKEPCQQKPLDQICSKTLLLHNINSSTCIDCDGIIGPHYTALH